MIGLFALLVETRVFAFCGFYVGKADASLFNEASQVIMARQDDRTVISMANDFKGDLKEFALVVPVPEVLQKGQVHIGSNKIFERLDAFSAPRLVEYFDEDPCAPRLMMKAAVSLQEETLGGAPKAPSAKALGVTIEASFTVGEYDIVILSAKQSDGLEAWLKSEGYKVSTGIAKALKPYILQNMKFFVAKVNLKEQAKTGFTRLRPIQFAFSSEKFMLPIRLGMANSNGPQDLLIYALTSKGRVESTNYRTVKMPTGMNLPVYIKDEFPKFYKDLFKTQMVKENHKVVFTEYFWDMSWCDPCSADPLSPEELREAGVFWTDPSNGVSASSSPPGRGGKPMMWQQQQQQQTAVKITRMHVRYDNEHFPEDLMFQETSDNENFQGRYVLNHPWAGKEKQCAAAEQYFANLRGRRESEAKTLASLTGWDISEIRNKMRLQGPPAKESDWWKKLWPSK